MRGCDNLILTLTTLEAPRQQEGFVKTGFGIEIWE